MNGIRFVAAVMLLGVAAHAQSAKVVPLSSGDAAEARAIQAAQKDLDARREKLRNHIIRDYLVTTDKWKASAQPWFDPDAKANTEGGIFFLTSSGIMMVGGGGDTHCETAEEKAARVAEQKKADEWNKAHPVKYFKQGWEAPETFEFSDDFQYIVPKVSGGGGSGTIFASTCPSGQYYSGFCVHPN